MRRGMYLVSKGVSRYHRYSTSAHDAQVCCSGPQGKHRRGSWTAAATMQGPARTSPRDPGNVTWACLDK